MAQIRCKDLKNERIYYLTQRITVSENPAFTAMLPEKRPAWVIIHLQDGRTVEQTVYSSQGGYDNPYPVSMVLDKFEYLAQKAVRSQDAKQIVNLCQDIENMDNVQGLTH